MKLMIEQAENISSLTEAKEDGKKRYYIEGIFLQSNIKNRNGRIYPKEILGKEVERYIKENVLDNKAVGELGHPEGPGINPDRISHKIVSLKEDGDNWVGRAMVSSGPQGKVVESLIEDGIKFGVSSRGLGTLKENRHGVMEVQEDFYLATAADVVMNPSAPDAWVNGIMEGVEYFWNNGALSEKAAEIAQKKINEAIVKKSLSKSKMYSLFEEYMNSLLLK